jgi:glutaminyl-peptide cyclotransferase
MPTHVSSAASERRLDGPAYVRLPGRTLRRLCSAAFIVAGCTGSDRGADSAFSVTATYPHDPSAYTQGLVWHNGSLYESTGQYGYSQVRRVDLATGRVLASRALPANRFGEGLALYNNRLYQLTWQSGVAYTYDAATLAPLDSFPYRGEGWGLTTADSMLIMSDGSDSLRFIDPATFTTRRVVHVTQQGGPVYQLNELEYVDGAVLANIYQSNLVLRIDPTTGVVLQLLDFADLFPKRPVGAEVMNGIATSPVTGELLMTGKLWPTMFRVQLHTAPTPTPR